MIQGGGGFGREKGRGEKEKWGGVMGNAVVVSEGHILGHLYCIVLPFIACKGWFAAVKTAFIFFKIHHSLDLYGEECMHSEIATIIDSMHFVSF